MSNTKTFPFPESILVPRTTAGLHAKLEPSDLAKELQADLFPTQDAIVHRLGSPAGGATRRIGGFQVHRVDREKSFCMIEFGVRYEDISTTGQLVGLPYDARWTVRLDLEEGALVESTNPKWI